MYACMHVCMFAGLLLRLAYVWFVWSGISPVRKSDDIWNTKVQSTTDLLHVSTYVLCVVCCVVCGMCYVGVEMIQYVVIVHILKFFYCFNTCLSGVYRLVTLKPTTYQSATGIFSIYLQQKHSYSLSTGEKRTTATLNKQYKAKKSGVISSYCFVCIFFNEFTLSPVSTFYFSV